MKSFIKTIGAAVLALGALVGCQNDKYSTDNFFLTPPDRKVNAFADAQVAAGAREEGTLRDYHFSGAELNSLGYERLLAILPESADQNAVIYLDLPDDASLAARRDAVTRAIDEAGVATANVKLEAGANPSSISLAATGLSRISKTDSNGTPVGQTGVSVK